MNNKNLYLLIIGILCAVLVGALLIVLLSAPQNDANNELPGESTVNTTETVPEDTTKQDPTNETTLPDSTGNPGTQETNPDETTGNVGGGTAEETTSETEPEETEDEGGSDIKIDIFTEPSEGEGNDSQDSGMPDDSDIEIDFGDL